MLPELLYVIVNEVMKRLQASLSRMWATKEMPATLATSAPHANATPTTSRPLAAARTSIGTEVEVEIETLCGLSPTPLLKGSKFSSTPPFLHPEKALSSCKLDWSLPSAGSQRV
ncbi:hypothetical protein HD554DRAFT_2172462 [Boletus coccyginus]|nr:hypothetical protein HD554DRAFT_2172462 [Boletus coccyginus]